MIEFVLGLILFVVPFLFMSLFSDKKKGFVYVLFFLLLFQTVLAVLTQALGIFYYGVVVGFTLFADIISLFVYFKIRAKNKKNLPFNINNIDWIIIIVAAVSFLALYQVHYNYTGKINLATDQTVSYHEVKNMVYPYPYFSDEWYSVSLIEGAISSHSFPLRNILNNSFFLNLELFFNSFIAQITLIFGLNPLLLYTLLSIFLNALIILLVYLFLRISSVPKLIAGICSLLILYITCGANLPGLWQLVPFNLGIMFFLLGVCFMEFGDVKTTLLSIVLAFLFYPPFIPFYFASLLAFLFYKTKRPTEYFFKTVLYILLPLSLIIPVAYTILMRSSLAGMANYILSRIFFTSLMAPFIPQIYFYNIIPMVAILLAPLGLYCVYKNKKWILLSEFVLGAMFWFFYSFTLSRFITEYERVVIFTSIIIIIIAGFGLQQLEKYILKLKINNKIIKIAEFIILFIFLFLVPFYTRGENWKKIVSIDPANGVVIFPKSPANNYLTKDDLRIFKDIKNRKFLSLPWKGTVIGVATGNYPILTKQGTISMGSNNILDNFLKADCSGKKDVAKNLNLDYIYIYEFNCPGFKKIDKSSEGLALYKYES